MAADKHDSSCILRPKETCQVIFGLSCCGKGKPENVTYLNSFGSRRLSFNNAQEAMTCPGIMYASRQYFMDGTCGVRVEHPEHVKVGSLANPHLVH